MEDAGRILLFHEEIFRYAALSRQAKEQVKNESA
jgi:hypothetical protein